MARQVLMPQAGQSMTEGRIVRWLVKEGTPVEKGEPILEIETDKANMEVEAPEAGILSAVLHREGDVVPVLEPLAVIAAPGEGIDGPRQAATGKGPPAPAPTASPSAPRAVPAPPSEAPPAAPGAPAAGGRTASGRPGRIAASPLARRLARRHAVDLATLRGSGPRGRIVRRDVEAALQAGGTPAAAPRNAPEAPARAPAAEYPPPATRPPARVPLAGMRKAIAAALKRSKLEAPHFYATVEVDVTALLEARRARQRDGLEVSLNDLLVRAAALALRDEPRVNCRVHEDAVEYPEDVNIGIAVGLEEGLVVPVLLRAQGRSLADIALETRRIIDLARKGKLVGSGQGTFTISNLGMHGVKCFTAIINPPEGAILAVGAAQDRVVPAGGGFLPRKVLEATLSADHRAIDGLLAARFLARLRILLEDPGRIL